MSRLSAEFTGKVKKKSKSILPDEMDADGPSMFSMDNLKSAGTTIGAGLVKGIADKTLGEGTGDLLAAGMQSGFNPYVMAGAAILGVAKSRAEKRDSEKWEQLEPRVKELWENKRNLIYMVKWLNLLEVH